MSGQKGMTLAGKIAWIFFSVGALFAIVASDWRYAAVGAVGLFLIPVLLAPLKR